MHTLALRAPCSAEPRLLPSRAKEQLLRGALRPPRLLSRSVWAAATGSTPGGLTGSRRVSAAFPAAGRPRAGPQRMQGLARTYLLVHRSRLLTASSHGGRAEQLRGLFCKDTNPTVGLRPGDLAACQRPRLPHLAAFGGHSRQSGSALPAAAAQGSCPRPPPGAPLPTRTRAPPARRSRGFCCVFSFHPRHLSPVSATNSCSSLPIPRSRKAASPSQFSP